MSWSRGGISIALVIHSVDRRECDFAVFSRGIQEERNDCVFADVFGDVLFGVVGAHLFLVDVFFKNVAEDVGVNFVIVLQGRSSRCHWYASKKLKSLSNAASAI